MPRDLGEVGTEPVATMLVMAGHLGRGVSELLLHAMFVDLDRVGKPRTQAVAREQGETFFLC